MEPKRYKKAMQIREPMIFTVKCRATTDFAALLVPKEAIKAVIQVPMLAPRTIGIAIWYEIEPLKANDSIIPIVAAED